MNNKTIEIYNKFGRTSFWVALCGLFCYMLYFPQGIYYCFFCGVMAVALALSARRNSPEARSAGGMVLGIVDVSLALVAYYGMYILFNALRNPESVAQINELISRLLSEYGLDAGTLAGIFR